MTVLRSFEVRDSLLPVQIRRQYPDFVHVPPGTPTGFPVTQFFSNEQREFNVPLAKRVMTDLNTTLLEQFLHISVTKRKAMVQPNCVLDDADRETVAVGLTVSH